MMRARYFVALIFAIGLFFQTRISFASHIRAGDITVAKVDNSNNLYRITVTLYRDTRGVPAQKGNIDFGDGTSAEVDPRSDGLIDDNTEKLTYIAEHNYNNGRFIVGYQELFRNNGVKNMINSGTTPFYIEAEFNINPFDVVNNLPLMTTAPIDNGAVNQTFIHNAGAYDIDGDSLSYELTTCKQRKDREVTGYESPIVYSARKEDGTTPPEFSIDPVTGDLTWDSPSEPGIYNVAFNIIEWRNGRQISRVNRDMQIDIINNPNRRPRLIIPNDTCVVALSSLVDTIIAEDPDGDNLHDIEASGSVFEINKGASTNQISSVPGRTSLRFAWDTHCEHVRTEPYQAVFKAKDKPANPNLALVDIKSWRIRVIGPAPDTLIVSQIDTLNSSITINWNSYACTPNNGGRATIMSVWRKEQSFDFTPSACQTGIPASAGYQLVQDAAIDDNAYTDSNLRRGRTYCYRIYAKYARPAGGEGISSMEVCATIPVVAPYVSKVSVAETNQTTGRMDVAWTKLLGLDLTKYPKPHKYQLVRYEGNDLSNRTVLTGLLDEADTTFTDTNLKTASSQYHYRVLFYSGASEVLIDSSATASSPRLATNPGNKQIALNWNDFDVPWNNLSPKTPWHYIYRKAQRETDFTLLDSVNVRTSGLAYTDRGQATGESLSDEIEYCYRIALWGSYDGIVGAPDSLENFSQEMCATPIDIEPPCPPVNVTVESPKTIDFCGLLPSPRSQCPDQTLFENKITWQKNTADTCIDDIVAFNIYHSPNSDNSYNLLGSVDGNTTEYVHGNLVSVAGCYYITAVDEQRNESLRIGEPVCFENCPYFELPNVFTPNGDGKNDLFEPMRCPRFVTKVDIKIYNRWGGEVFSHNGHPLIKWDGTSGGQKLPSGTYVYEATVQMYGVKGNLEEKKLKGWVHIISGE